MFCIQYTIFYLVSEEKTVGISNFTGYRYLSFCLRCQISVNYCLIKCKSEQRAGINGTDLCFA